MFERFKRALGLQERGLQIHTATDYGRDILVNSPDGWEHDQQFMWWVDGPGGGSTSGFGNPPPDARFNGADALPAVMRCTALICDTLAGLPWNVYRGYDQQPTPRWISDPQLAREDKRIYAGPTQFDALSAVEFRTQWILSALWFGDGFAYADDRIDQATGLPRGIDPATGGVRAPLAILDPQQVQIQQGSYWINGYELDPRCVVRLRGEPPYQNGQLGTGVLERFAGDITLAQAMRVYASNIFSSGIPSGYLKVHAPMVTEQQADTLQTRWMGRHGTPRRKVAVLNGATDFVPLTISPVDSALGEAKTWSLRDIALAFGVPAYLLGVPGDSSTYANVESRMTEFRTFTLLPWIRRIESTLDSQFPLGTEVKIMTDSTLRADPSTRFASYQAAIASGWLTVDEVRSLEDRPPLPEQVTTDPEESLGGLDPLEAQRRAQIDPSELSILGLDAAMQLRDWRMEMDRRVLR